MNDQVLIQGLQIPFRIGCRPEERELPQLLELNLRIGIDARTVARTRALEDTVCWSTLARLLRHDANNTEWILLEQLAEHVTGLIFERFSPAKSISLEIRKFVVPGTRYVGCEIHRERESTGSTSS